MALTEITKVTGPGIHTLSNVLSHNIKSSGIITATKFSGPLDSIGGNFAGVITATSANFSGNVTIGGTLTYEDVTNIDSIGIVTARDGLKVLGGGANIVGVVTATTFKGDGDFVDIDVDGHTNLDNVSIAGVTTFTGKGLIDNTSSTSDVGLRITNNATAAFSTSENLEGTTNRKLTPLMLRNGSTSANTETYLGFDAGNTSKAQWNIGVKKTGALQGDFIFNTRTGSSTSAEKLRIDSSGRVLIGGTSNSASSHADELQVINTSAEGGISIINGTSSTGHIYFGDTDAAAQGRIDYNHGGDYMRFHTANEERLRITSTGSVLIDTTVTTEASGDFDDIIIGSTSDTAKGISIVGSTTGGVGSLTFTDGASYKNQGIIQYRHADDSMRFTTAQYERLRITSGGSVGIGTLIPQTKFEVSSATGTRIRARHTNVGGGRDAGFDIWSDDSGTFAARASLVHSGSAGRTTLYAQNRFNIHSDQTTTSFYIARDGKVGVGTESPRAVMDIEGHAENATLFLHSNDANANLAFSDNTGGTRILNYGGDLAFRTGANAHAFGTGDSEKLRIEDNGSVGIGTDDASWGLSGNGGLVVGSGTGSQAITIFCASNGDISFGDSKSGTARYAGLIRYSHGDDSMRFRTATSERLLINSSGNIQIGSANNPGNALRYLDVYNTNTGSSAGSILRLLTTKSDGSSAVGLDIVKYKAGGAYIINNENVGADTGFIAFNTGSSGISPATHMRIAGNGEVIISPRNGGAGNNRTSIHFNNATHTPFIAFKSNNLTEAVYIKAGESSGGANLEFQTKNTSGTILSRLTLKHNGEIVTHQLAGGEKGYPLIMGTGTVSSNTNMSGSFNLHDVRGVHTGGGPNYHIGGWVYLGHDYGPAPYPARRFKIFAPSAFSNGTIVYQVWHNGDANYMHGGLWEIRMNLWTDGDIESVTIRCINGSRDDIRVYAYNDSNGIMIQTNSIWGQVFIRRAGWDDGGRNPGSSHCAVANNAALAIYNSQGTDDGAMPTSGSPVEVYAFDGTSGSAGATHTGAYSIENSSYFDG